MALVQIIPCGYQALDGSWGSPVASNNLQTSEIAAKTVWPVSGVFRNFIVRLSVAPGEGKSRTITVRINGVDTAMAVTISGTETEGTYTSDLTVTAGQALSWEATFTSTPATTNLAQTIEFAPTDGVTSGYTMRETLIDTGALRYNAPFSGDLWSTSSTTQDVVATDGTVTALYGRVTSAPSGGNGVVICLYLNGVKQDGTGDTVDTTLSFLGAATASVAFALPVMAGDVLYLEATPTGTYTSRNWTIGAAFQAADPDTAMVCGRVSSLLSESAIYGPVSSRMQAVDVEASLLAFAGVSTWSASHFYVALGAAPGAAKSYTFVLRENSATPTGGPTVIISGTDTAGHDLNGAVPYTTGDSLALQFTPTGTPTAFGQAAWSILVGPPIVPPLYTEGRPDGGESLCNRWRVHTWLELGS